MSRDKWKIIGKSDDCGRCKIPAAAKHPVTSVGCVCKYLPVAARLREPIRGEAGDSGDASATPAADRSSGRIRMCPPGSGCCSAKSPRYGVISNSGAKRGRCDLRYGNRLLTLQLSEQFGVDQAVGGADSGLRPAVPAGQVGDAAAGFLQDQRAGGDVVKVKGELPVAVKPPRGDVAEIQRGGAVAADALNLPHNAGELLQIVGPDPRTHAGETGGRQRIRERGTAGNPERFSVQGGSAPGFRGVQFVQPGGSRRLRPRFFPAFAMRWRSSSTESRG